MTFTRLRKAADLIILSAGWRQRLIAFLAGACGALAMAPVDFFPAMLIPMTVSVWLLDGAAVGGRSGQGFLLAEMRAAAAAGWWLGFGYFTAGLWWLGAAMLVDADEFAWAIPLASLGMPAVLACFSALGFALARCLWSPGAARVLALAAGLGSAEWLRGHVATGFPWNEYGMALGGNLILGQAASLVGLYGLNFIAVAIFASPALLNDPRRGPGRRGAPSFAPILCLAAFATLALFGALRLAGGRVDNVAGARLRIMQPNLRQDNFFRPENKNAILDRYVQISDRATSPQTTGISDVTHLIWPESAFPFILSTDAASLARLRAALGPKAVLITGAARVGERPALERLPGESRHIYYNAIQAIDQEHGIIATYDKVHLVPFGEYLPFGGLLERFGIRHLVHIPGGFSAGAARTPFVIPGLPLISALVCYEAVFPGEVMPRGADHNRPGAFINVSNDSWYAGTPGPYQHLSHARLRAIEEGLPLVRAANTGVSAFIDPYGRVISSLPANVEGVLDGVLPKAIAPTPFARWPLTGPIALLMIGLIGALLGKRAKL